MEGVHSGIARGVRGHAPNFNELLRAIQILKKQICCHQMCSFELKMRQNRVWPDSFPNADPLVGWGGKHSSQFPPLGASIT